MKRRLLVLIGLLFFLFANSRVVLSEIMVWHQAFTDDQIKSMKETKAIIHTAAGDITLMFFPEAAPNHVYNFIQLSRIGFYNRTLFHRVIPGFVIQGGDPNSRHPDMSCHGQGGPGYGYHLKEEFNSNSHKRGTLSMARSTDVDSAGSQFFICVSDRYDLDGNYTVFGQVTEGMAVVDAIVSASRNNMDHPLDRIEMEVKIITSEEGGVKGDVNGDGRIGLEEAIHALQIVSGINKQSGRQIDAVRSTLSRDVSPDVEQSELRELVTGNSTFALELYQAIREENSNLFYSPYSMSLALAMTYAGAKNETEQQMGSTLNFTLFQDRLHPVFNALDLELASRGEGAHGQDGEGFRLNIANSIWGQTGYSFLSQFLDVLAENYGAGLRLLDFCSAPDDCRIVINDWVSDQTEKKIENLIPQGAITPLTRLVLTNTIYFNAAWSLPFQEEVTQNANFYLLDRGQLMVPMMAQTEYFGYTEGENYQAVELLYDGEELSMVILLPKTGHFEDFESSLTLGRLDAILDGLGPRYVQLKMPKFTYESASISVKNTLAQMGMPVAFSPGYADFSGMDGTRNLFISDVIHKAFVSVDEAGTEAAAATAVIVNFTSVPTPPIEVTIDRPFIFFIRDIPSGAILFVGRIVNPAE